MPKYSEIPFAIALGFAVGLSYADILSSSLVGDFSMSVLSILFLLCCIMYPLYGYVPESGQFTTSVLLVTTLLAVYLFPIIATLSLGLLISSRSIDTVFRISGKPSNVRIPVMIPGFIIGSQFPGNDYSRVLMLLFPTLLGLCLLLWNGDSQDTDGVPSRMVYTREVLLGARRPKSVESPTIGRVRGG